MSESLGHCLRIALACMVAVAPCATFAQTDQAEATIRQRVVDIDVAPQSITTALIDFSKQANVQVLMPAATVAHLVSGGAQGRMPLQEALDRLLSGTSLTYRIVDESTVTIFPVGQADPVPESAAAVPASQRIGQDAAGSSAPSGANAAAMPGDDVKQLEVIMVTAQKRSQSLQDVPVAVSAIRAETLASQNLVQIRDFYSRIPGLSYLGGAASTTLALRGIIATSSGNPTVATTIDDVPFGASTGIAFGSRLSPNLDPANLDHIEVLRGPQGTLYGASSLGGLLKYVTRSPDPNAWSGTAELSTNTVDSGGDGWSARASLNVPIATDRAAASVSAFYREDPGYIDFVTAGVEDANSSHAAGGRLAFFLKPSDGLTINLSALRQDLRGFGAPNIEADAAYQPVYGALASGSTNTLATFETGKTLYTARVQADLGTVELVSVTGIGKMRSLTDADRTTSQQPNLDAIGLPQAKATLVTDMETDKITQEVRLLSTSEGRFNWMLGSFYTKEDSHGFQALDARDLATGALLVNMMTAGFPSTFEELAGFVDLNYQLTGKLDIQAGSRVSRNDQRYTEFITGALFGAVDDVNARSSDRSVTWLLTPRYKFSEDLMSYVRIATGYRPGGPNTPVPGIPGSYRPDTTINYEFGIKGSALDRMMSYAVAIYRIDWDDIQLGLTDSATQFFYYGNGNQARSQGVEVEFSYRPWMGMMLSGNAAYNDAYLTGPIANATASVAGGDGDRLPYSPRLSANLSADQTFDLGEQWTGSIGASASYLGQRLGELPSLPGLPRAVAKAFTTYDLRGSLEYKDVVFGAYIRNLTNKVGYTSAALRTATIPANGYLLSVIQPRTVGVSVGVRF